MTDSIIYPSEQPTPVFAGFGRRAMAWVIDSVLLVIIIAPIFFMNMPAMLPDPTSAQEVQMMRHLQIQSGILSFAIWIVIALFESSRLQATPGKLAVSLRVCDDGIQRVSLVTALLRSAIKLLVVSFFVPAFLIILFTPRKKGLHDFVARTVVVRK